MKVYGRYRISGRREFRGHAPDSLVVMGLDELAEQRARARGDITLIERIEPEVPPGYELPQGWLRPATDQSTETPQGVSFVGGGP